MEKTRLKLIVLRTNTRIVKAVTRYIYERDKKTDLHYCLDTMQDVRQLP